MANKQRIFARLRLSGRALAGVAVALCIAFAGAVSADGLPPDNDNWANAITVSGASGSTTGTTVEATTEAGEPLVLGAGVTTSQTIWWKWVATSSDTFTFAATSGDASPTIAVYTGAAVANLTEIASDAELGLVNRVFFDAVVGTTYYLQVGAYPTTTAGAIALEWEPNAVANDDFAEAAPLPADVGVIESWNVGATVEVGEPNEFGDIGSTVWYSWTPAQEGIAVIAVAADFARPTVAVYTGSSLATLQVVESDLETVQFDAEADTTYFIQIGGNDTSPGTFSLGWELVPRPANDDLAAATDTLGGSEQGTTVAATLEVDEPTTVNFSTFSHEGVQSVWYRWAPGASGPVDVSVLASLDDDLLHAPLVQVFEGPETDPTFGDLTRIGTHDSEINDPVDTVHAVVDASRVYYVQVLGYLTSEQDTSFDFTLTIAYDNDDFADALPLEGLSGAIDSTLVGATLEPGEPEPDDETDHTVWFSWTAPETGTATFAIEADDFNAVAAIYTGASLVTLEPSEVEFGGTSLALELAAEGGTTYYLQLGTNGSAPRDYALEWSFVPPAPANDAFADAEVFDSDSGTVGGTTNGATLEAGEPDPAGDDMDNSVWYTWTPSASGAASISLSPEFDATLAVYTGSVLESLEEVDSDLDTSTPDVSFDAVAGTTYSVQVGTYFDSPGAFSIAWELASPQSYLVTTTADDVDDANCVVSSCTLRQAINAANAGSGSDEIELPAGTYQLSGSFGALFVNEGMTITGAGARTTSIVAAPEDRVLDVTANAVPVSVAGVTLTGGTADAGNQYFGGNVRSAGDLTLTEVTVTGGSASSGGGLSNWAGTMLVDRSTITGNQALTGGGDAGGIQNYGDDTNPGVLTIRNSTISGNTANLGGAIWSWGGAASPSNTIVVEHSTIAFNSANAYSGGVGGDGAYTFRGSIVSANTVGGAPGNCYPGGNGTIGSLGDNLESGTDCGFAAPGDVQDDPLLGALADNGGPTDTHALASTSPARDAVAGTCPPPAFDQRGTERPQGSACDIGAFELFVPPAPPNDDWANAEVLAGDTGSVEGTTVGSTPEAGEPDPFDGLEGTVWYRWTPGAGGNATLSLDASFLATLAVYTGDGLNALDLVADDSDSEQLLVRFPVTGGTAYSIQVGTPFGESPGAFTLEFERIGPPANDKLADAVAISGRTGTVDGTTDNATVDANDGEPVQVDVGGSPRFGSHSVWYRWTPGASGESVFTAAAHPDDFAHEPLLGLYRGPAANSTYASLVEVGTNASRASARVDADASQTYYVQVMSDVISETNPEFEFTLSWISEPGAPTLDSATGGNSSVALAWSAAAANGSPVTAYRIYRGTTAGGETLLTTLGNVTAYTDATAVNGTTYFYKVSAANGVGEGALSNELSATPATVPGAPTLASATPGNASVALAWSAPASNGGSAITGYRVHRGTTAGGETLLATLGNVTAYTDATAANGTTWFYKVSAVNAAGESALSNELSATPADPNAREISGTVLAANGSGAAGILVHACLATTCADTTSGANGAYAFAGLGPGVYVVRALPADPALLASQADAEATLQSVQNLDLRLVASGAGSNDAGPSTFRVTGCVGGSLHYVATGDGVALGSGDVADSAGGTPVDGVYTIDVGALNPGHVAVLRLDVTITCANATETQTAVLFTDPSGTVVDDAAGGAALAGATVTILDANGNPIPSGDPRLSPATSTNPQTSDARGGWGWDVAPGTYLVRAQKANCGQTTSGPLTVTAGNPVTGVVLHLSCATPPGPTPTPPVFPPTPPAPTPGLPDPVAGVNFNVEPISGTVLVNGVVLPSGQQIPFGAVIDATNGIVSITTIGPNGLPQTAYFYGGEFQLTLAADGVTTLVMRGGDFTVCPVQKIAKPTKNRKSQTKRKVQSVIATAKPGSKKVVRALWGTGKGSFRTAGRYSSATVRGTLWYHADRCDGTFTQVNEGSVTVFDTPRRRSLIVRAGHSVLIRPR